jgi:hypothetical protein|tara:strand:- start:1088 stop:1201 length:114 start_codon:yes stop_codon:yes gene_type:complete
MIHLYRYGHRQASRGVVFVQEKWFQLTQKNRAVARFF